MKKKLAQNLGLSLGCLLVLTVGFYFLTIRSLDKAFAKADFSPVVARTKAAVAGLVVARQPSIGAPGQEFFATGKPATIQSDAKLLDAWVSALQIAETTLTATSAGSWVRRSDDAIYLGAIKRRDPWDHYVCVLRRGDVVAVIGGGPKAPSSPVCSDITVTESELEQLPRARLLETPAGNLILLATKHRVRGCQVRNRVWGISKIVCPLILLNASLPA